MQQRLIYHILVKFFQKGKPGLLPPRGYYRYQEPEAIHGDLAGVIQALPYLQDLGVDTIWLSPIHPNRTTHCYDVEDYFDIDPYQSDTDPGSRFMLFKELLHRAREKNIKIILDLVLNHVSHSYRGHKIPTQLSRPKVSRASNSQERQWSHTFVYWHKKDKATEEFLIGVGRYWLYQGVDGFRLDYVPGRSRIFWKRFCDAMRRINPSVILIGEAWEAKGSATRNYQFLNRYREVYKKPVFGSLFDFTLQSAIVHGLGNGSLTGLAHALLQSMGMIGRDFMPTVFLDNHDMPRFLNRIDNPRMLIAGLILCALYPGYWCLEYGTELGVAGHSHGGKAEERGRVRMPWERLNSPNPIRTLIRKLARLRQSISHDLLIIKKVDDRHLLLNRGEWYGLIVKQTMIYPYRSAYDITTDSTVLTGKRLEPGGYLLREIK